MKSVLITGCSDGGIGSSLATNFSKSGCHVYATARNINSMSFLADNEAITLLALDVCNRESITKCRDIVSQSTGGTLDVLVNNAGIAYSSAGIEMDVDTCRQVYEANVFGVMEMNKAFGHMLVKAEGTILSTGSVAGLLPVPFGGIYHSSKAALAMYNDCIRLELEPLGVKVVNAVTGQVQSNIVANSSDRYHMADDSYYRAIQATIDKVRESSQGSRSVPTDVYAKSIVSQTLRANPPPRIYKGGLSTISWVVSTFMPYWVIAFLTSRRSGMNELRSKRKACRHQS